MACICPRETVWKQRLRDRTSFIGLDTAQIPQRIRRNRHCFDRRGNGSLQSESRRIFEGLQKKLEILEPLFREHLLFSQCSRTFNQVRAGLLVLQDNSSDFLLWYSPSRRPQTAQNQLTCSRIALNSLLTIRNRSSKWVYFARKWPIKSSFFSRPIIVGRKKRVFLEFWISDLQSLVLGRQERMVSVSRVYSVDASNYFRSFFSHTLHRLNQKNSIYYRFTEVDQQRMQSFENCNFVN